MDLLKGGSLKMYMDKRMNEGKPLHEEEASLIMSQIFEALQYIHIQNYMHRDLKPENVMLAQKNDLNSICLIDFGIGFKPSWTTVDNIKSKCGTWIYMAPEQLVNFVSTKSADIWSCGIILYQLLTFRHPFYDLGDTEEQMILKMKKDPFFPEDFPKSN